MPLYDKPLGVVNFVGNPRLAAPHILRQPTQKPNQWEVYALYEIPDFSKDLIINPEVSKIADIDIQQEIIELNSEKQHTEFISGSSVGTYEKGTRIDHPYFHKNLAIRFTIHVIPKNGDARSVIIKTIRLDQEKFVIFC